MLLDKKIPFAYILNKIKRDILVVFFLGVLLLIISYYYAHVLPEIPLTIPVFLGTAISILLSFKLNQSYDRWWEARKIWGSIVNDSRTFTLQLKGFVPEGNKSVIKKMVLRQIGWCYSLGQTLRELNPVENLYGLLSEDEIRIISSHKNKPLAILDLHTNDIRKFREAGQIDVFSQVQLDNTLIRLCDAQGRAERIKSTVFPVTYRKFLHYIIYLFMITLSVSLNNLAFYYELPILIFISSAFLLLEKSATHMQDPFMNRPTDTAMTTIARTIEINLKQLVDEKEVPEPLEAKTFYAM